MTDSNPGPTAGPTAGPSRVRARGAGGGRRVAGGRARSGAVNPLLVLAVILPLLSVGALLLVKPSTPQTVSAAPQRVAPVTTTLMCATSVGGVTRAGLADRDASGDLTGAAGSVPVAAGAVVTMTGSTLVGSGPTATGLAAVHTTGTSAALCSVPRAEQWFTGVGAGAEHRSELHLTNPDNGTAVADVRVLGATGPVDVPALRGLSVPAGETVVLDLAAVMPQSADVALQVAVSRGRLGVVLADRFEPVGTTISAKAWLAPAIAPERTVRLAGLGKGRGNRVLTVANPGPDATRVQIKVTTGTSEFEPTGVAELQVPAESVQALDLTRVLDDSRAQDATGVVVTSTSPVTAGLRSLLGRDVVQAAVLGPLGGRAGMPLPARTTRVVLSGATQVGTVSVQTRAADGTPLDELDVSAQPGQDSRVTVSKKAAWLDVDPGSTGVRGVVELGNRRKAVMPLVPLVFEDLIASVRPALW